MPVLCFNAACGWNDRPVCHTDPTCGYITDMIWRFANDLHQVVFTTLLCVSAFNVYPAACMLRHNMNTVLDACGRCGCCAACCAPPCCAGWAGANCTMCEADAEAASSMAQQDSTAGGTAGSGALPLGIETAGGSGGSGSSGGVAGPGSGACVSLMDDPTATCSVGLPYNMSSRYKSYRCTANSGSGAGLLQDGQVYCSVTGERPRLRSFQMVYDQIEREVGPIKSSGSGGGGGGGGGAETSRDLMLPNVAQVAGAAGGPGGSAAPPSYCVIIVRLTPLLGGGSMYCRSVGCTFVEGQASFE